MDNAARILVVAFVILLAYHFLKRPCNLSIVVRGTEVDVRGPAIDGKKQLVGSFFREDMPALTQARIDGHWDGHYLRLAFHGPLSPADKQRIRNFLLTTL